MAKEVILEKDVKLKNGNVLKAGRHKLLNRIAEPLLSEGKAVLKKKTKLDKKVEQPFKDKK